MKISGIDVKVMECREWEGDRPFGKYVSGWQANADGKFYAMQKVTNEFRTNAQLVDEAIQTLTNLR